jgi:hypothetical protein
MAMLTSAFAYLGSYYSEANPSLQGRSRRASMWRWADLEARPNALHQGRQDVAREHGQANIQSDWKGNYARSVSVLRAWSWARAYAGRLAWHTESAKVATL